VALDFFPDKPLKLVGIDKRTPEIPTIPSTSEVLMETLEKIPLAEIADNLLKVTEGVERIVNSPEMKGSMKNLDVSLQQLTVLIRDIDAEVKPTLTAARNTFTQAEKTLAFNDGKPGEVAENLNNTLKKVDATLEEMRLAITTYEKFADRNMNLGYDVGKTLQEIEGAAKSIRALTDYLERHPEALVKGKQPAKGE
jgi:paraquat-inducible protein B